jgi:exosome complex component RRP4
MSAKFENRDLVVPGDVLFEGRIRTGDNTFRSNGHVSASRIGLVNYNRGMVSVISLEAGFNPLSGDLVIGEITFLGVQDAIDAPFRSDIVMPEILDVGETIIAKIVDLDRRRTPILSILGPSLGKVKEGFIFRITPSKIPRLIGKKGSMVNMILKETGCNVVIGQNGRILIQGRNRENEMIVVKVIEKIEQEAHISGLTTRVQEYLKELKEEIK